MKRKVIALFVCLIITLGTISGCSSKEAQSGNKAQAAGNSMELGYTTGFQIKYLQGGIKLVTDGSGREVLLLERGKDVPSGYEKTPVVRIPIERAIVTAETQGAMLRPSEAVKSVVGYTKNINEWYIEELKKGVESGVVVSIGDSQSMDFEKVKQLSPDVVFLATGLETVGDKLTELGIPYIMDSSDWEADPMARMEWIKFFSAFYNKEKEVEKYFKDSEKLLDKVVERAKGQSKPKVLWGFLFKGKSFVPYAGSYVGKHIELSGGDYVFSDLGPDKPHTATITAEEFYAKAQTADVYISSGPPSYHTSTQDIVDRGLPVMKDMKPIQKDAVWCYQPWYYQEVDKTPEVIMELQAILYPELYPDYKEFKYYWKVPKK